MPKVTVNMPQVWQRVNALFKTVHALESGLQEIEIAAIEIAFARRVLKTYDDSGASSREDVSRIVAEIDKRLDDVERETDAKMREGAN